MRVPREAMKVVAGPLHDRELKGLSVRTRELIK